MLLKLIAAYYPKLIELTLWIALGCAALVGYHFTLPILAAAGATPSPELTWKLLGALLFSAIAFLTLAVVTGPIATLLDIKRSLKSIETRLEKESRASRAPPAERREPTI
jgi:hypothetical protein